MCVCARADAHVRACVRARVREWHIRTSLRKRMSIVANQFLGGGANQINNELRHSKNKCS